MKKVYVVLAFHAHELLWDLPEKLLSYLEEGNPMKGTFLDENYIKKRKEEDRDIYTLCSQTGERLGAPMCVEFSNELLVQIKEVLPESFENLRQSYQRGRFYPLYGHAHHTHTALLTPREMSQEIMWNRQYVHNQMQVPYPKYNGLFPTEASLTYAKMDGIAEANIDYVICPHLNPEKAPFHVEGGGDYMYKPYVIKTSHRDIIAFPRNFPISQEIWRPITRMKRDAVKPQGYKLGDYPVFDNEYLHGEQESFPIDMAEGVEIYKKVLRQELEKAPHQGVLVYIQDLELMDFGDIALEIMEKSWQDIVREDGDKYGIEFITPDMYMEKVLLPGEEKLPFATFKEVSWSPEIRLILRSDGHYPPLGVTGVGQYDKEKTGLYQHPQVFWENGKYYCGIFDTLLENFGISTAIPADVGLLEERKYDISQESLDSQIVLYHRLMKRACNWGWRPTEGRQKLPCLKGYLICSLLRRKLRELTPRFALKPQLVRTDPRNFVGISESLQAFIDARIDYLKYGLKTYAQDQGGEFPEAYAYFEHAEKWKQRARDKARELYAINKQSMENTMDEFLQTLGEYSQALFMATEQIQWAWGKSPDTEHMVDKMYEYLYEKYPPYFPAMIERIDSMEEKDMDEYFAVGERELLKV